MRPFVFKCYFVYNLEYFEVRISRSCRNLLFKVIHLLLTYKVIGDQSTSQDNKNFGQLRVEECLNQ